MTARLRAAALACVVSAAAFDSAFADQSGRPRCLMQSPPIVYVPPPTGFIDADEPDITSFFLTPLLMQYETGLVAWVYRPDPKTGRLVLDLPLSRRMAEEIATAYKIPLDAKEIASAPTLAEDRRLAAAALDALAADRCSLPQENRR